MTIEDIVRKRIDAWNRHDLVALVALYSPEVVSYGPFRPDEGLKGREAFRKAPEAFNSAFPGSRLTFSNLIAKDDIAWFQWELTGTHKGPFQTAMGLIPPTNKLIEWRGAMFERVSNQLIVEERAFADAAGLMRQLGVSTRTEA